MSSGAPTEASEECPWHARSVGEVFQTLQTDEDGLSPDEAERRLTEYGPNEIRGEDGVSPVAIFVSQFQDVLIYLLILAAVLSILVGFLPGETPNYVDAGLILLILLGNGVFGFVQDYRAEKAMQTLRDLSSPDATVIRDGVRRRIDATAVVPGDVVVIEQGDAVPADARLIGDPSLETKESALTGESASVPKRAAVLDEETPLADRTNMVYMDTDAVRGRGRAVVVETGMDTEVGSIATQIQEADEERTPFQREVDELGRHIGYGILVLIALVVVVQFQFTQAGTIAIILTAITLAVAAVPEGLPAVVTLTLALGSQRMVKRNALVRRLPVVESLGAVDVILTDKTGTLTENQMTVRRIAFGEGVYEVTGPGLEPDGEFRRDGAPVDPTVLEPILRCGVVCNNAEPAPESETREYYGDPTEVSLLVAGRKAGIGPDPARVREIPFSSDRKRMTVVAGSDGEYTAYMKGAARTVLERCDRVLIDDEVTKLTGERRQRILERNRAFAGDALRVLAFSRKSVDDPQADEDDLETGHVFLGLQGMIDPPRRGVDRAVRDCREAGIRVVMVTGDNLETAVAIGNEIGFDTADAKTGVEIDDVTDEALRDLVSRVSVFARVTPGDKVRILEALQANDHRVAMTGDGVNDAPGLRSADVGIAMGIRGTDVAQEASDMVLQDDDFVTIRDAIAEKRAIFDNIRKFVNLLLSANAGEVFPVFLGVLVGSLLFPHLFAAQSEALILTPIMLLWINLVTDGLPALALGVDPKAPDVLERGPRSTDEPVIDRRVSFSIVAIGVSLAVAGLAVFFDALAGDGSLVLAQTPLFTFFVVAEMGIIQRIRRRFGQTPFSNPWLVGAVLTSLALQLAVLYTPLADLFDVSAIGVGEWIRVAVAVAVVLASHYALAGLYGRYGREP